MTSRRRFRLFLAVSACIVLSHRFSLYKWDHGSDNVEKSSVKSLTRKIDGWECYNHRPNHFVDGRIGSVCKLGPSCYFSGTLVTFSRSCKASRKVFQKSRKQKKVSWISPVKCGKQNRVARDRTINELVNVLRIQKRMDWLQSRKSVQWWNGTTLFSDLDDSATNIYHLVSKLMTFTYFNNFSDLSLPIQVDRILLHRSKRFKRRLSFLGPSGAHSIILQSVLRAFFHADNDTLSLLQSVDYSATGSASFLSEKLFLEGHVDLARASELNPVCFESIVLPGCVRGTLFEGDRYQAGRFSQQVHDALGNFSKSTILKRSDGKNGLLLYPKRYKKRRFGIKAEKKLTEIIMGTNMAVETAVFDDMPFERQFGLVQSADVILGIHGANLLNPSLFLRPGTVIVELFPYHFLWRGYANTSMAAGGIYVGYMLDGKRKKSTRNLTISQCYRDQLCLHRHRDVKTLSLSVNDTEIVRNLLVLAGRIALKVQQSRKKKRSRFKINSWLLDEVIGAECLEFDPNKKMAWVSYIDDDIGRVKYCTLKMETA